MPFTHNLPFLCIFLAMAAAILLSVVRNPRLCWNITFFVASASALMSLIFLAAILCEDSAFAYTMGKFPAPFGNEIKAGPLQALFASCFSLVSVLALLGGKKDLFEDADGKKLGLTCVMLNMVLASLLVLTYTNDVFTAYVFIEISTIAACALVMAKDSGETLVATIRYLFMSLLGSGLFLLSLFILYGITGHLLMPQLSQAVAELLSSGVYHLPLLICAASMAAGLGIKSAMFPFHRWLPDAHGSATTCSSAVLSGLVLKGYAVLMITMFIRIFSLDFIRSSGIGAAIFLFGLLGMIAGSIQAIRETHAKRMLAYSSVAQMGYVFMGIGLCSEAGIAAACYQILAHAFAKPLLFSCVGKLSAAAGHDKQLSALRGSAWSCPLAGIGFAAAALSMIGIPLFAGFTAKLFLASASIESPGTILALSVLGLSSVLNAIYYLPALIALWIPKGAEKHSRAHSTDPAFTAASVLLIAGVLVLGIFSSPIMAIIIRGLQLM